MKYYAIYDENGNVTAFGTTSAATVNGEITEAEYLVLKQVQDEKTEFARQVFTGEITLDDVPEEYREDVAAMVEGMRPEPRPMDPVDEALAILRGEVVE